MEFWEAVGKGVQVDMVNEEKGEAGIRRKNEASENQGINLLGQQKTTTTHWDKALGWWYVVQAAPAEGNGCQPTW